MASYGYDPTAPKDPNCVACANGWAIFVHPVTKVREHVDLFDTCEAGILQVCPTQDPRWKIDDAEAEMEKTLDQLKTEFLPEGAPDKRDRKACEIFVLGDNLRMSPENPEFDTAEDRYGMVVGFGEAADLLVVETVRWKWSDSGWQKMRLGKRSTWHMSFWIKQKAG